MLWHLQIRTAENHHDSTGRRLAQEAVESGLPGPWRATAGRGFLVEGRLSADDLEEAARRVLVDPVVESFQIRPCPTVEDGGGDGAIVHVTPKPGVTDPEAESALALLRDLGYAVDGVRSIRSYRIEGPAEQLPRLIHRVLANDAVEQV